MPWASAVRHLVANPWAQAACSSILCCHGPSTYKRDLHLCPGSLQRDTVLPRAPHEGLTRHGDEERAEGRDGGSSNRPRPSRQQAANP